RPQFNVRGNGRARKKGEDDGRGPPWVQTRRSIAAPRVVGPNPYCVGQAWLHWNGAELVAPWLGFAGHEPAGFVTTMAPGSNAHTPPFILTVPLAPNAPRPAMQTTLLALPPP